MLAGPAYRITTDRLILRCYDPCDAPALKAAIDASLHHLAEMPWSREEPQSLDDKIALLRRFRGLDAWPAVLELRLRARSGLTNHGRRLLAAGMLERSRRPGWLDRSGRSSVQPHRRRLLHRRFHSDHAAGVHVPARQCPPLRGDLERSPEHGRPHALLTVSCTARGGCGWRTRVPGDGRGQAVAIGIG